MVVGKECVIVGCKCFCVGWLCAVWCLLQGGVGRFRHEIHEKISMTTVVQIEAGNGLWLITSGW
jgi:hypothetical protein